MGVVKILWFLDENRYIEGRKIGDIDCCINTGRKVITLLFSLVSIVFIFEHPKTNLYLSTVVVIFRTFEKSRRKCQNNSNN